MAKTGQDLSSVSFWAEVLKSSTTYQLHDLDCLLTFLTLYFFIISGHNCNPGLAYHTGWFCLLCFGEKHVNMVTQWTQDTYNPTTGQHPKTDHSFNKTSTLGPITCTNYPQFLFLKEPLYAVICSPQNDCVLSWSQMQTFLA